MRRIDPIEAGGKKSRSGFLLVVVLVVIMLGSLVCYQFADRMTTERQIVSAYKMEAQAQQAAQSGIDYLLALVTSPDFAPSTFATLPPEEYAWQLVIPPDETDERPNGLYCVLVSRERTQSDGSLGFGLSAEGGKINLNGLVELDVPEDQQRDILMQLPAMTETIADTILDFIDADASPREYGTESDDGDFQVRNGPLISLDDLLQIPDITPSLLYGEDANRNGLLDPEEDDGPLREPFDNADGLLDAGWNNWLTVWSRESNLQSDGSPKINVNSDDLETLRQDLAGLFSQEVADFIIAYRQSGPAESVTNGSSTGGGNSGSGGAGGSGRGSTNAGGGSSGGGSSGSGSGSGGGTSGRGGSRSGGNSGSTPAPPVTDSPPAELSAPVPVDSGDGGSSTGGDSGSVVGSTVNGGSSGNQNSGSGRQSGTGGSGGAGGAGSANRMSASEEGGGATAQVRIRSLYEFVDASVRIDDQVVNSPWVSSDLSFLQDLEAYLTIDDTETRTGRIDLNYASYESLAGLPNISSALVDEILNGAGNWQSVGDLLSKGVVDIVTLRELEPFLTTSSRTYRFTSIGLWQTGGPIVRMEVVIDAAAATPVVLTAENLTPLGPGHTREELLPADLIP
ncbi:MAG: type II secretion system protein GspK [Planctomycetaceae bacterium]|nr:general secretion pathway protein GspK [Planctomycetaceae bacterium]